MSKKSTKDSIEGKLVARELVSNMSAPQLSNMDIAAVMLDIGDYFLWDITPEPHENILLASKAIQTYWSEGGYLNLVITGLSSELLDSMELNPIFEHRVFFKEKQAHIQYLFLLRQAKFLFHPALHRQDLFTVLQAAQFQVPIVAFTLESKKITPVMMKRIHFFAQNDLGNMVEALHFMEKHYPDESLFSNKRKG